MGYTASALLVLVGLGGCVYVLARAAWSGVREGGFQVGKPRRCVTSRANRGEFLGLLTLWVVLLVVMLALLFIVALSMSGPDGFSNWLSRFFVR